MAAEAAFSSSSPCDDDNVRIRPAERRRVRGRRRGRSTTLLVGSMMLCLDSIIGGGGGEGGGGSNTRAMAFVLPSINLPSASTTTARHNFVDPSSRSSSSNRRHRKYSQHLPPPPPAPSSSSSSLCSSRSSSTNNHNHNHNDKRPPSPPSTYLSSLLRSLPTAALTLLATGATGLLGGPRLAGAEDELAQYAKEGNKVGVDAKCFVQKCSLPTHECVNNPDCLKGLSCLSKCKGEGTCSTACFAKYGNGVLDEFLHCAVEKQDCVHVPRDRSRATWTDPDTVALDKTLSAGFDINSLEGKWYKVMGMDARYDCFDCQVNHFTKKEGKPGSLMADVQFRMPRPRAPGFWENHITEELLGDGPGARRSMHSVGRMFGLTFWENWYVLGENSPQPQDTYIDTQTETTTTTPTNQALPPYKFIYYTGHTLQGNYEGAFVYARTPDLPRELLPSISRVARANGLDPTKFCKIRNTCFNPQPLIEQPLLAGGGGGVGVDGGMGVKLVSVPPPPPMSVAGMKAWVYEKVRWFPQQVEKLQVKVGEEMEDWFEDPSQMSEWLIKQQERVVMAADDYDYAYKNVPPGTGSVIASENAGGGGKGGGGVGGGGVGGGTREREREREVGMGEVPSAAFVDYLAKKTR